jgi:hypothetical protein
VLFPCLACLSVGEKVLKFLLFCGGSFPNSPASRTHPGRRCSFR